MASGSKSSTSTQSSQSTNVSELNLQDTGGITIADNKGATNLAYTSITSDEGAIAGALKLATNANDNATNAAITLGSNALDTGAQVANHGLDNAAAAYQSGLTFGTDALNTVANILDDSLQAQKSLTASALSGYQTIAQQNSASNATQIQQVALYVIVAAVAIIVLPKVFK